jgi:hypothetical protein
MAYSSRRGGRIGEVVLRSKSIQNAWRRFAEGGETEKEDSGFETKGKLSRNIGGEADE